MNTSETTLTLSTKNAQATVRLQSGCLTSYYLNEGDTRFDILRPTLPQGDIQAKPASFPLIPYSNRIKQGRFDFAGTTYSLPLNFGDHPHSIHGVGWQALWQVKQQTANSIVLELNYEGDGWPFAFYSTQTFSLEDTHLRHELSITNTSSTPMPAGLGMHPYFPRHQQACLTADVTHVWLTDDTCLPTERTPCPDNWKLHAGAEVEQLLCDNQFELWNGVARIEWPQDKMAVDVSASEDLNRLVVYAPDGEDFFCIEPVSHMTDAFNQTANGKSQAETGMRVLEPSETWTTWMKFSPHKL